MEKETSAPVARPVLVSRYEARQLLLHMVTSPRSHHVAMLDPDEQGALFPVSRQMAIDMGKPVYVGKVSTLDKPYPLQGGGWGSVRYTANGNTEGQLRAARIISKEKQK